MKYIIVATGLYFKACLCWLVIILLCLTIIGVPFMFALKEVSYWFDKPIWKAHIEFIHWFSKH